LKQLLKNESSQQTWKLNHESELNRPTAFTGNNKWQMYHRLRMLA